MENSSDQNRTVLRETDHLDLIVGQAAPRRYQVIYRNVCLYGFWHIGGLYGLYLSFTVAQWSTVVFTLLSYTAANTGLTAGAHRLWAHRAYKAKLPLEILLMLFQSLSCQNSIIHWARDHRLHHKYSDTDADPHNATRGMFYSHIGWLLVKKHPEVLRRGRTVELSDLYNNPVLKFQKKYSVLLITLFAFLLPTFIPVYCWGETLNISWHLTLLRIIINLNIVCLVNSAAHAFGYKPYDKNIAATQSITLSLITLGECFHNYHHVFPWDYRTAELGNNGINFTTKLIDFFAWIGWAYDLKTVSGDTVVKRVVKTGDGTDLWGNKILNQLREN